MDFLFKDVFEFYFHVEVDCLFCGLVIVDEGWDILYQDCEIILRDDVEVEPVSDLV